MAPRKPKLVATNEAKDFDFDAWVLGFQQPQFTRSLYQRADLLPRLAELDQLTTDLQERLDKIEAAQGDQPERSITEIDPASTLRTRLNDLIEEFNTLYQQYEASAVAFTFRVPNQKGDWDLIKTMMREQGVDPDKSPGDDEDAALAWLEAQVFAGMTVTCTSHPLSLEQWKQFRLAVGEQAISGLVTAWNEAVKAALPAAPFSPKPSPGPDSDPS